MVAACLAGPLRALCLASLLLTQNSYPDSDRLDAGPSPYDRLVDEFILYDIGRITHPFEVHRIRTQFGSLQADEAVPALVRGLNRATEMRASCPITAISGKLRQIVSHSKNPAVATYVLQHLEPRDIGNYRSYIDGVFRTAEERLIRLQGQGDAVEQLKRRTRQQEQPRLAHIPGMKLTDLAPRNQAEDGAATESLETASRGAPPDRERPRRVPEPVEPPPPLDDLSVAELLDALRSPSPASPQAPSADRALEELYHRAAAGSGAEVAAHADLLIAQLKGGEPRAQAWAARLLGLLRVQQAVPDLIDRLEHGEPPVRSAASIALTRITRQLFGPSEQATDEEIRRAVTEWRVWWAKQPAARR